jgi:hypothetical protein
MASGQMEEFRPETLSKILECLERAQSFVSRMSPVTQNSVVPATPEVISSWAMTPPTPGTFQDTKNPPLPTESVVGNASPEAISTDMGPPPPKRPSMAIWNSDEKSNKGCLQPRLLMLLDCCRYFRIESSGNFLAEG